MTEFMCAIATCDFTSPSPLGMTAHARAHKHAFETAVGRPPANYQEVKRFYNTAWTPDDYHGENGRPATLADYTGGETA